MDFNDLFRKPKAGDNYNTIDENCEAISLNDNATLITNIRGGVVGSIINNKVQNYDATANLKALIVSNNQYFASNFDNCNSIAISYKGERVVLLDGIATINKGDFLAIAMDGRFKKAVEGDINVAIAICNNYDGDNNDKLVVAYYNFLLTDNMSTADATSPSPASFNAELDTKMTEMQAELDAINKKLKIGA